jgi:hypothetical protein
MLQCDANVTKKVGHMGSLHQSEFSFTLVAAHNEKTQIVTTELELIKASAWREFLPRLPDQPIFYPVTNQAYAVQITRDWNVKASGAGFAARFAVKAAARTPAQ